MKNTLFYLSTCSTCTRIIKEIEPDKNIRMQDIKFEKISPEQLDELAKLAGSFEELFSRRAMKFRSMGLHEKNLSEKDYRNHILEEYTFLKRPVLVYDNEIFVGSAKKTVEAAKNKLHG